MTSPADHLSQTENVGERVGVLHDPTGALNWPLIVLIVIVLMIGGGVAGFTFSQFRIAGVEKRVGTIEQGNPCLEKGPNSKLCQRSRNLFAATITFAQACQIVHKANPTIPCFVRASNAKASERGGGQQSSPNTGSQLPGGLRAPRPSPVRKAPKVRPVQQAP